MIYKRGSIWWYEFQFQGSRIREATGLTNKGAARDAEVKRKNEMREARAGVSGKRTRVPVFNVAAESYLKAKRSDWKPKTYVIETTNLAHLGPAFGSHLLSDIDADDVATYRAERLDTGAAPKTIALELGTLRALMRYHDLDSVWTSIKKKVTLAKAEKVGRVISVVEENSLLSECRNSRSRSLYIAVVVALQACLRYSELRLLRWQQVDLGRRTVTVGKSKTEAGEGRAIPMSKLLHHTLSVWAEFFPARKLNDFVFPRENYGHNGAVYNMDATKPIGTFKYAWQDARKRAGVSVRFHDLRHTGCTRMLDAGVPHTTVAEIMGWSTSTAIRMVREVYGHVSLAAKTRAIEQVEAFMDAQTGLGSPLKSPQTSNTGKLVIQ